MIARMVLIIVILVLAVLVGIGAPDVCLETSPESVFGSGVTTSLTPPVVLPPDALEAGGDFLPLSVGQAFILPAVW